MPSLRKFVMPEGSEANRFLETRKRPLVLKNEADVNKVRRMGIPLETKKKMYAATNKQRLEMKSFRKLENETEELRHPKIPQVVGQVVMRRRNQLGMSQAELAAKIKQSAKLVAQLESIGGVVHNNGLIKRLEAVLGVQLSGKELGKSLQKDDDGEGPGCSKPLTRAAAKKRADAEAAAKPKEAAAKPKEAAAEPKEAAAKPKEAAAKPKEAAAEPKKAEKNTGKNKTKKSN